MHSSHKKPPKISTDYGWGSFSSSNRDLDRKNLSLDGEVGHPEVSCQVVKNSISILFFDKLPDPRMSIEEKEEIKNLLRGKNMKSISLERGNTYGKNYIKICRRDRKVFLIENLTLVDAIKKLIRES